MNMETIIGLLFILLPVIFKFIGKRLEQSGQTEKADKLKKVADRMLGNDEETVEETPFLDWLQEETEDESGHPVADPVNLAPVVTPVPAVPQIHLWEAEAAPVSKKKLTPAKKSVKPSVKKPILEEEAVQKKREKIDPKKLVIYSEIMKPKY